jgi:uncharacterized protein
VRGAGKLLFATTLVGLGMLTPVDAGQLALARSAYARGDYVKAARLVGPLAERGNASAQALLGFLYANGHGVPQAYDAATYWYRLSADQGDPTAQYLLGLMYDKGQGVPLDDVAAYMWLNLAAAHAPNHNRDYYVRLRNAVASKMTRAQIADGQWLALQWTAGRRF